MVLRNNCHNYGKTATLSVIVILCAVSGQGLSHAGRHGADKRDDVIAIAQLQMNHHHHHQDSLPQLRFQRSPLGGGGNDPSAAATANVCNGLCNCTKEKEIFLNVVCDFTQNIKYLLDERHAVPANALAFHVNLGAHAQLYIRGKLFRRLNRISIDGGRAGGRQQIDFGPRAFHDNAAPFPEIDLKHAQTVTIHGNAFQGYFKLNVANVANVVVQANAFQNTSFLAHFSAVDNLRFEKDAFLGTRDSQIQIIDSHVGLLERMDASMQEIKLQNCRIDAIKANTFDVVSIRSIVFDNCDIDVIESNFTTERLLSQYLGIVGCRIGLIQANAIASSGFSTLEIERNTIQTMEGEAIRANAINFTLSNNVIHKTGSRWLTVREWSSVRISNNSVGHFDSIDVQGQGKTCLFARNSITQWTEGSLTTMSKACQFQDNVFSTKCTCNYQWIEKLSPENKELRRTSYCELDKDLRHCFNATTFNADKFHKMLCGETRQLDCTLTMSEKKVEPNFLDPNDFPGGAKRYGKYLYLAGAIGLALLLVCVCLLIRLRCPRKTSGHDGNRSSPATAPVTSDVFMSINRQTPHPSSAMTHDNKRVKAFTDHDRATVELSLDRLRTKYSSELYDQVNTYTMKLMNEHLSETEKVLTIGEIVRLLDECENIGDDFLAFTDIIYRHLDENNGQTDVTANITGGGVGLDPLYADPGLIGATTTLQTNLEADNHIYAEPNSAQQPLLKTEYSLPLDRSDQAVNVYADPVETHRGKSSRLVTPYAIGNQLSGDTTSPQSAATNLPDVLSRSVPASTKSPPPLPAPKLNTFGKNSPGGPVPGTSRGVIPMYSIPQKSSSNSGLAGKGAASQRIPLQRDDSSSSSCNSSSNHSGGSDITFKIDDIADHVDT